MIAPVLAPGDEDEVERGRGRGGKDGLGPQALFPEPAREKIAEEVAAGREDDPDFGPGEAQADKVDRDVAGVPAERSS